MNTGFKDHFSTLAKGYARYRPQYPSSLFAALAGLTPGRALAWDCATGSGQAAGALAEHFDRVVATDASAAQLAQAAPHPRVKYRCEPAEETTLESHSVSLTTVAQALHWFDLDGFYAEVRRVSLPGAVLAVWSYGILSVSPEVDAVLNPLYHHTLEPFWPPERSHVDEGYASLPFPFEPLSPGDHAMTARWRLDELLGYLRTWSAVKEAVRRTGQDPVAAHEAAFRAAWGDASTSREVRWPLHVRTGRVA